MEKKRVMISSSRLLKESAKQYAYTTINNIRRPVTKQMEQGNRYADKVSKVIGGEVERRAAIRTEKAIILASFDVLKDNEAIEIKSVIGEVDDWYVEKSILQSIFYCEIFMRIHHTDTPVFMQNQGVPNYCNILPDYREREFKLRMGNVSINIEPNPEVFEFYKRKADIIAEALIQNKMNPALSAFDSEYNRNEWKSLGLDKEYNIKKIKEAIINHGSVKTTPSKP